MTVDTDKLVARLRSASSARQHDPILLKAADAIDTLLAERKLLREALKRAPIIGRGEPSDVFRQRQDEWLNTTYRTALNTAAPGEKK